MTYKNTIEKIESEIRPLEVAFENMLKQINLKPETREKIIQNLNAFSMFRTTVDYAVQGTASPCFKAFR